MKITRLVFIAVLFVTVCTASNHYQLRADSPESIASGGGHFVVAGSLNVQFNVVAVQHNDGRVSGSFHHSTNDGLGTVDFYGSVTCLAVDKELGRAWIGGVIDRNLFTSPDFTGDVNQPGHDIWFRVLAFQHEIQLEG